MKEEMAKKKRREGQGKGTCSVELIRDRVLYTGLLMRQDHGGSDRAP